MVFFWGGRGFGGSMHWSYLYLKLAEQLCTLRPRDYGVIVTPDEEGILAYGGCAVCNGVFLFVFPGRGGGGGV